MKLLDGIQHFENIVRALRVMDNHPEKSGFDDFSIYIMRENSEVIRLRNCDLQVRTRDGQVELMLFEGK